MERDSEFIRLANSPKFNLFLLRKLPSAFFCGVRVERLSPEACEVRVPYKWFSQNPFNSTYFACLAMAAELSTGALAMANVYKRKPAVSMLVVKMEAEYFKKATGVTLFSCQDGAAFQKTVNEAIDTGVAQTFSATSMGTDRQGELIAKFIITWSFKSKGRL